MASASQPAMALKQCRHGKMLYLRRDTYVGRSLDLYGEFSELESRLFSRLLRPGQVVVEVGANIGAHTVHLAKLVGPRGRVLAFEPQRMIYDLLCSNLAVNHLRNVRAFHAAAGAREGALKVPRLDYGAEDNFGGVPLGNVERGERVSVIALDSLRLRALRLLKVDVEGMETEVLLGAQRTIARHRPALYVENDRRENSRRLMELIARMGYTIWWHLPALFNPRNYAGNLHNVFNGFVSVNLLCLPEEGTEQARGLSKVKGPGERWQSAHYHAAEARIVDGR